MQGSTSTLTLGRTVKCEDTHEKHTVKCTMESYARGIARAFKDKPPVSFERNLLKIACVDASKVEDVRQGMCSCTGRYVRVRREEKYHPVKMITDRLTSAEAGR